MEEKIQACMKALDCSREEAIQMLQDDEEIEHGADLFPLDAEQAKVAKAMTQAERTKEPKKRERKIDPVRQELFDYLKECIFCRCEDAEVITPDREITCVYGDKKFKITLSCPRS